MKVHSIKRLTKAIFIAFGIALTGFVVTGASAAPTNYCGSATWDSSLNGYGLNQSVSYDAGIGRCKLIFVGDVNGAYFQEDSISNLRLPGFVSSINVAGVGGGGSTALDASNWWNDYFNNFDNDTINPSDSGSGGGGGASFYRNSLAINTSYSFSLRAGAAGVFDQGYTASGYNSNSISLAQGYMGNDGGSTTFTYNNGTSDFSITANGGKAPTSNLLTSGGAGGTLSGTTSGWTTANGSSGLPYNFNNASPNNGQYIDGLGNSAVGQGGGSKANGYVGDRGDGYGSGGGGSYIDSGQYYTQDTGCYLYWYRGNCDGRPGAVAITYAALNYIPVEWSIQPFLFMANPVVGIEIAADSNYQISNGATGVTYTSQWYRCTSVLYAGTDADAQSQNSANCVAIAGATSARYTPTASDVGKYLQQKVTATNSGTGSTTTIFGFTDSSSNPVVQTPSAPTLNSVVSRTPTSVKLSITPSTNWGSYQPLTFKMLTSGTSTELGSASFDGTNLNVSGLTPNTSYTVKITQTNEAGTSPQSASSLTFTTPNRVTVGVAPMVTGDYRSGKTLTLTTVPWTGNGAITISRNWYSCPNNIISTPTLYYETVPTVLTNCIFRATGQTYVALAADATRRIYAVESASDEFSTSYYRVQVATIKGEMDAPTLTGVSLLTGSLSGAKIRINFDMPAFTGASATVTNTVFAYSSNGGSTWSTTTAPASTSYVDMELSPATTYVLKVALQNTANGTIYTSEYSSVSQSITTPSVITASTPLVLSGTPHVGGTMAVNSPVYSGDFATSITNTIWLACAVSKTGGNASSNIYYGNCLAPLATSGTQLTLTPALMSNTSTLHLVAVQTVSDGYATRWFSSSSVLISRNPSEPRSVSVTASSTTSLSVSFTAPLASGSSAVSAYRYSIAAGPSFTSWSSVAASPSGSATTFSIGGLTANTEYKVRVYARNSNLVDGTASADSDAVSTWFTPSVTGSIALTGNAQVGQTLTASANSLTILGSPAPTNSWSWFACGTASDAATLTGTCSVISGQSTNTLLITSSESMKYIVARLTATNSVGSASTFSAATAEVPGVPGRVTNVVASVLTSTSLRVTYDLPSVQGGTAIDMVQYQVGAAPFTTWTTFRNTTGLTGTFDITGLVAGTDYQVVVRANNSIGFGQESVASATVTTFGPATVAQNPTISGQARVGSTLTASEPGAMFSGNPAPTITARQWYSCTSSVSAGNTSALVGCTQIAGATSTSYVIQDQDTSKYLLFVATGTNPSGSALSVSASSVQTANVPAAPTISLIALSGSGSINVDFIAGSNNHSTVTAFQYELNGSGTWVTTGGLTEAFAVAGLTNGQQYSLRIRSTNAVGNSAASSLLNFTTLAAPTGISAVRSDGQATISWSSLAGAQSYSVSYATNSAGPYSNAPTCVSIATTSCVIDSLTNSTSYYVKVLASNANGSSPLSNFFGPFTPLSRDTTLSAISARTKTAANSTATLVSLGTFVANQRSYSVTVPSSAIFATLTPTAAITGQTLRVNGAPVSSASASSNIALDYGANTISIEVSSVEKVADANSDAVNSYVVTITRSLPDMSSFTNFVGDSTSAKPLLTSFSNVGVTGVTSTNLAAITSAMAQLSANAVDSPAEIQAVVNSYIAVLGQSVGGTPTNTPTAADYVNIGVTAAQSFTSQQVSYLNSVIASKSSTAVGSVANVQVIATAVANLYSLAASSAGNPVTVAQLVALGVVGVTNENLPAIIASIAATADDGSGINTVAKVQALVDSVKAASVSSVVSSTNGSNAGATVSNYASAGVVGVTSSNLSTINAILASLPSSAKDSTAELQSVVNSYALLLAQSSSAADSELLMIANSLDAQTLAVGPTSTTYATIGATVAASLSSTGIAILNSIIKIQPKTAIDTPAKIDALAAAAQLIETNVANTSVSDFTSLGLKGVTATNLATVKAIIASTTSSNRDSFEELQKIIDSAVVASIATNFANSNGSVAAPTAQAYLDLGVTGVSSGNLSALNSAIRQAAASANPAGSWVATTANIQALLTTLSSGQQATIRNYDGTATPPVAADYQAIGVIGVSSSNLAALNSFVSALSGAATATPAAVQSIVDAYKSVITATSTGLTSSLSLAQLQSLGVTGVNSTNFLAVARSIASANSNSVDSLAELQALVTTAIASSSTAATAVLNFSNSVATAPTLAAYSTAGFVGVTASNKQLIEQALTSASPAPSTASEVQGIIDAVLATSIAEIANLNSTSTLRASDFAMSGIAGVTPTNQQAIAEILASLPNTNRDSVLEIQNVIDSFNLISSIASGAANSSATAAKPTVANFVALGVDLGTIATDREAFDFFVTLLSNLPASVLSSPSAIAERAQLAADLVRVASNKSSITTLGVESFATLGILGVNSSNLTSVLSQISAGSNGVAGIDSLRSIVSQYAASVAPETPPAPVVPKPPVVVPPVVTPPVAKPTPPVSVVFSAGSTTLSAQAKAQISTKVGQLLKAGSKSLVITSKVTLVKNASNAWTKTVMTAAKARAAAVNKVVRAKLAALGVKIPVVVKVVTTTVNGVRQVQIQGK